MADVRTKSGADTASNHHLLVAKMKLKLKKHQTTAQKYNTAFLRDTDKLNKFKITLSNKFQAFHDLLNGEGTTMESKWKGIKGATNSTCHEVLGHKKHYHKEWITVDTLDKIQKRRSKNAGINISRTRAEKAKPQAEYTEVDKQVEKDIRTDKRKCVEEKAAREGNMRQLYDTTKKLSGNHRKPERPVKSKDGKIITNNEKQRNRWVGHFKELLNRPAPLNPPNIEEAPTGLPIDVDPQTIEEISMAIREIKSGRAAGPDSIPAEALKADAAVTERILHILFNKIWDEEQVPTDRKEGHIIKIPKIGNLSKCDNYTGITLPPIPGKVFNKVLLNRMKDFVDAQLRDQQAGFRKDRSCTDQIAKKAFNSVDRTTLWKILRHYGVPEKIVNIIRNSYDGLHCKIVHGGQLTDSFEVKTGVRQGCLLSPFLFLLVIDWIIKTSTSEGKHGIQWTARIQLDDLCIADDLALLSHTQQQMQEKTTSVAAASAAVGFNIHKEKSKILRYKTTCTNPVTIDGEDLEDEKAFTLSIILRNNRLLKLYLSI
ncbi:unnamed protein product [Schistosoma curassoni]|uniref:Reverse transcriptase domain-containing protein n=1 Tax=Schistosoma curassoni TaxID=6186 RepID=A0A183KG49_9TREM|nr:unnamed protein product [Schistosoma curassoni]